MEGIFDFFIFLMDLFFYFFLLFYVETITGCPKKNALSELCGICVRTKFFGYFGYFEQASLQPSF